MKECCTDTDTFSVQFPMDLDVKMKAAVIGACFLIVSFILSGLINTESHHALFWIEKSWMDSGVDIFYGALGQQSYKSLKLRMCCYDLTFTAPCHSNIWMHSWFCSVYVVYLFHTTKIQQHISKVSTFMPPLAILAPVLPWGQNHRIPHLYRSCPGCVSFSGHPMAFWGPLRVQS